MKYVRRYFGFLDPLPPLVRILIQNTLVNSRNLAYYVRFWVPSPSPSVRTYLMDGPQSIMMVACSITASWSSCLLFDATVATAYRVKVFQDEVNPKSDPTL